MLKGPCNTRVSTRMFSPYLDGKKKDIKIKCHGQYTYIKIIVHSPAIQFKAKLPTLNHKKLHR